IEGDCRSAYDNRRKHPACARAKHPYLQLPYGERLRSAGSIKEAEVSRKCFRCFKGPALFLASRSAMNQYIDHDHSNNGDAAISLLFAILIVAFMTPVLAVPA